MKCANGGHDNAASAQFCSQCGSTLNFPCPDRAALAAHLGVLHNRRFAFAQITAPTLVIAGEDDTLSPEPEKLAEALPRGQAVIVEGDHAGAKTTETFIDAVTTFLNIL